MAVNVDELSEQELDAIIAQDSQQPTQPDVDAMSEQELDELIAGDQREQEDIKLKEKQAGEEEDDFTRGVTFIGKQVKRRESIAIPGRTTAREIDTEGGERIEADVAGAAEAGLQSFAQGATLGFLPQIQAGVSQLVPDPGKVQKEELEEQGFTFNEPEETFILARDRAIVKLQELQEEFPTSSLVGQLAGILAPGGLIKILGKSAGIVPAATVLGRTVRAVTAAGAEAIVANPGDVEGVVSPLQLDERVKNFKEAVKIGGGVQLALELAPKGFSKIAGTTKFLKRFARNRALKAAGAIKSDLKRISRQGKNLERVDDLGEFIIEKNLIEEGDDAVRFLAKVDTVSEPVGKEIKSIYKTLDGEALGSLSEELVELEKKTALSASSIADELDGLVAKNLEGELGASTIAKSVVGDVREAFDSLGKDALDIEDLWKVRKSIDSRINWSKQTQELPEKQQQLILIRNKIKDKIEERLAFYDKTLGTDRVSRLRDLNKEFSKLSDIKTIAQNSVLREQGNRFTSLGDRIAGATLAATVATSLTEGDNIIEKVAKGTAAFYGGQLLSKLGRTAGPAVVARVTNFFGDILQEPSNMARFGQKILEAGRDSPAAVQTVLQGFRNDPRFLEIENEAIEKGLKKQDKKKGPQVTLGTPEIKEVKKGLDRLKK